ncbi:MAG: phosphoribosylaminoimidazolesuccinocarboxamide synthase [Proteobacteria bacterium]|nr:phosphoribosylaminoimidazolesuccinocarboxamide synthase [Pseudomonadota bacterium]
MIDPDFETALANRLTDAEFRQLPNFERGKVRDSYDLPDGRRVMIATDRQSAFDLVLAAAPYKGQVLNQTAKFWFEQTADLCPNHVLEYPDPNVIIGRRLTMLRVEMVVRAFLTGSTSTSIWPMYECGERTVYGHALPDGMIKNQPLEKTIITPSTKGMGDVHDVATTADKLLADGIVTPAQWDELCARSFAVFARGQEIAARHGLILVDTKYEFGVDENGTITLADEVHTPDSSRYWIADSYDERFAMGKEPDSLDKEFLRLWINARCNPYKDPIPEIPAETLQDFSARYIRLYEQVTGRTFERPPPGVSVRDRIEANLRRALPAFFSS